jgi:hypothetical protein
VVDLLSDDVRCDNMDILLKNINISQQNYRICLEGYHYFVAFQFNSDRYGSSRIILKANKELPINLLDAFVISTVRLLFPGL